MIPQEGVGGWVPSPRKDSAASVRIANEIENDDCTSSGAMQFGRTWSTTTRRSVAPSAVAAARSEEHTSELQSQSNLVCRLLLEKKKKNRVIHIIPDYP